MTSEMPIPRAGRARPTGWAGGRRTTPADTEAPASETAATPPQTTKPPRAPRTTTRDGARGSARPELSRHFTLRLRSTTEEHLDGLLEPLSAGRVDRTELIHALIEAADPESAKAAVLARRRRHTEFD